VTFRKYGSYAATVGLMYAATFLFAYPAGAAGPTAELSINAGTDPLTISFVAASTGFPAPIVSYSWKFGDGQSTTTSGPIVMHTYASTGEFAPKVTEVDSEGNVASAQGTLALFDCPASGKCSEKITNARGVKTLKAVGLVGGSGGAGVDLFVGPYQIQGCDPSVGTDGALSDVGFSGPLKVKAVYSAPNASNVATTCFSSEVPFVDAQGQTVNNGALPSCSVGGAVPPCVESIRTVPAGSELQVTKVLMIPPGDPKVGAL
jgi:PKD domain-containing protein